MSRSCPSAPTSRSRSTCQHRAECPSATSSIFPGSTIGNFSTGARPSNCLMKVMRDHEAKDDGALLIGVDLEKPRRDRGAGLQRCGRRHG